VFQVATQETLQFFQTTTSWLQLLANIFKRQYKITNDKVSTTTRITCLQMQGAYQLQSLTLIVYLRANQEITFACNSHC
jgi:bifunctional pyridoxal-dependent enzyme with beta-cystathionase and maltose regulon repressor activities